MKLREVLTAVIFLTCVFMVNNHVIRETRKNEVKNSFYDKGIAHLDVLKYHDVQKRGVGAFIAMFVLTSLTIASSGIQLWTAVEEGCNFRPSICTDRDEIHRLEGIINGLADEYDTIYYANKWKYLNLKLSMINNAYILHYINDTLLSVDDIGDSIGTTNRNYQVEDDVIRNMFAKFNDSVALTHLINPLEFQLEQIQEQLRDEIDSQMIGLAVQGAAEVYLDESVTYIDKIVLNSGVPGLDVDDNVLVQLVQSNSDLPAEKRAFWETVRSYFDNVGQSLGSLLKSVSLDVQQKYGDLKESSFNNWWITSRSWSSFKSRFTRPMIGNANRLRNLQHFFKNPGASIKYSITNYEFDGSQAFLLTVGLIIDSIQFSIQAKHWKEVADELAEARKTYEEYYAEVSTALEEMKNETKILDEFWTEEIDLFQDLVSNFVNITTEARENELFFDIFDMTAQPVDQSDLFYNTDFDTVDQTDLQDKQQIVINYVNNNGQSLVNLDDEFKVKEILVSETKFLSNIGKSIDFIYNSVRNVYENFDSAIINSYNSKLTERDVVCSTSLVLPNVDEYDHYPIGEIRTAKCDIAVDGFSAMQQQAEDERDNSILNTIVRDSVPMEKETSTILDLAKAGYSSSGISRLVAYGAGLTEQDIVCKIATIFTNITTYNFYDLTQFRPDCSMVTTSDFTTMENTVQNMENGSTTISYSMTFCAEFNQCTCPDDLASITGLTIDQVNLLIEEYKQENNPDCTYVQQNSQCFWQCIE